MSNRMENYLGFAEKLGDNLDPESIEYEPKKYLLTWIPGGEASVETLKTFDSIKDMTSFVESIYNPWVTPRTMMNLDNGKVIDWALGVDDVSNPGQVIFTWGIEE